MIILGFKKINTMKIKFGLLNKFKVFKALVKNKTIKKITTIGCNRCGEYSCKNFNTLCKENGIVK